jgi:hypothetical protein
MDKPQIGCCFLDTSTVQTALALLIPGDEHYKGNRWSFLALQNFIEALILHNKIYIDDTAFIRPLARQWLQNLVPNELVGYCQGNKALHRKALHFIREHIDDIPTMSEFAAQGVGWVPPAAHLLKMLNVFDEGILDDIYHKSGWEIPSRILSNEHKEVIDAVRSDLHDLRMPTPTYSFVPRVSFTVYRTVRYLLHSSALSIRYAPHPAREPVVMWWLNINKQNRTKYFRVWALDETAIAREKHIKAIENFVPPLTIEVKVPLLFSEVLKRSKKRSQIIDTAIELRNSPYARSFRSWGSKIEDAISKGEVLEISKAVAAIQELKTTLEASRESKREKRKITIGFPVSVSIDIDLPKIGQAHLIFLRKLFDSLGNIGNHENLINKLFDTDSYSYY